MSTYSELWNRLKPYAIPDMRAIGTSGGRNTSTGGVATMEAHVLATTSTLGTYHTVSGLTAGQVLKATGATDAAFGALAHTNLTGIGANDHHNQVHAITGADHTITASQYQVVGATASNTLGLLTPSADVSGGATALLRSNAGTLTVGTLTAGTNVRAPLIDSSATLTLTPGTYAILSDGKRLRTSTYTSGFAGAGFQLDQGVTTAGKTFLELDNLSVRGTLSAYELLIRQIRATNGAIFVSSVMKVASYNLHSGTEGVAGATYRLYPDTTLSDNVFLVGDLVRAQRFTGSGTYKSDLQITYVDPGNAYCIGQAITAKGPGAGYEYVRLGSASDANRRGGLYLSSDDTGAPFIDIFNDVDSHSDWNTAGVVKMRLGKLDGITSGTNEYGMWAAGANSGDHLLISPTSGFELVAGNGIITLTDADGLTLEAGATVSNARSVSFTDGTNVIAYLTGIYGSGYNYLTLQASDYGSRTPQIDIFAGGTGAYSGKLDIYAYGASTYAQLIIDGGAETIAMSGAVSMDSTLGVTGTLTVGTINKSTGVNLQYNGSTKLATVTGGVNVTGALGVSGDLVVGSNDAAPGLTIGGSGTSTGDAFIDLGAGRTGSGNSYIDIVGDTTYTDYGLRIIRANSGADAPSSIIHRGTGDLNLRTNEAGAIKLRTNNTLRATVQSSGELIAEYGVYVNGDQGGISGYVGLTDVTTGISTGTGTVRMNSTSSGVASAGWLKAYVGTTTIYIPYWTSMS